MGGCRASPAPVLRLPVAPGEEIVPTNLAPMASTPTPVDDTAEPLMTRTAPMRKAPERAPTWRPLAMFALGVALSFTVVAALITLIGA
jgi:hypothetical protein